MPPRESTSQLRELTTALSSLLENIQARTPEAARDIEFLRSQLENIAAGRFASSSRDIVQSMERIAGGTSATVTEIKTLTGALDALIQSYGKFADVVRSSQLQGYAPAATGVKSSGELIKDPLYQSPEQIRSAASAGLGRIGAGASLTSPAFERTLASYGRLEGTLREMDAQVSLQVSLALDKLQQQIATPAGPASISELTIAEAVYENELRDTLLQMDRAVANQVSNAMDRLQNSMSTRPAPAIGAAGPLGRELIRRTDFITDLREEVGGYIPYEQLVRNDKGVITSPFRSEKDPLGALLGRGGLGGAGQLDAAIRKLKLSGLYASEPFGENSAARNNVLKYLGQHGLGAKDLRGARITREQTTGISTVSINRESELFAGQMERMTFTVDKFGNVLGDTQKRFRTFGDAIRRDTVEFLKWTIAATLILGPLRKVQELIDTMIQTQSQLADVQIATGQTTQEVYKAFEAAAAIARETGTELSQTVETYTLAYRAAGNAASEFERTADASTLLKDSLTLAKLAGIEQAQAVDILSGGLKQLGLDFEEGQNLIAGWLAVTKSANVSMETLAQSFAITASAAENVGLSVDQLNGVIAATAEVTNLSATETGNMVRAIISGYQTDNAASALADYGIAIKDTSGEMRDFLDIFQEIKGRADAGLISEKQLAGIAEILGGGARRGAQVSAFIRNLDRVDQVAAASGLGQTGDVAEALGIKLETVETAAQNLGNAFIQMAQSVGTEGGVLGLMTDFLQLSTVLVGALDSITGALGTVTPALLAYAAATELVFKNEARRDALISGRYGRSLEKIGQVAGRAVSGIVGLAEDRGLLAPQRGIRGFRAEDAGARIETAIGGIKPEAVLAGGYVAYGVITALREGNPGQAIGNAVGAAFGYVAGGPVGAVIGSTIGGVFANVVQEWAEVDFANTIREIFEKETPTGTGPTVIQVSPAEQAKEEYERLLNELQSDILVAGRGVLYTVEEKLLGEERFKRERGGTREEVLLEEARQDPFLAPLAQQTLDAYERFQKAEEQRKVQAGEIVDPVYEAYKNTLDERITPFSEDFAAQRGEQAFADLFSGVINKAEFDNINDSLLTFQGNLAAIYTEFQGRSLVDAWEELTGEIGDSEEAMTEFSNLFLKLTDEQRQELIKFISAIGQQQSLLSEGLVTEDAVTKAQDTAARYLNFAVQGIRQEDVAERNLGFFNLDEDLYPQLDQILQKAQEIRDLDIAAIAQETGQTATDVLAEVGDLGFKVSGVLQETADNMSSEYVNAAIEILKQLGIIEEATDRLGFRQLDIESGQFGEVLNRYKYFEGILGAEGYQPDETEQILLFSDDQTEKIRLDLNILELALQDLIDVNRKQLDGIYNLPTDATFYVPLAAAELDRATRNQLAEIDTTSLDNSAQNLDTSAVQLGEAGSALLLAAQYLARARDPNLQEFFEENPEARTIPPRVGSPDAALRRIRDRANQEFFEENPEARTLPPLANSTGLNRASIQGFSQINVPVTADLTLESQHNITLTIDRAVIGAIVAAEVGRTIAQSRGLGGSITRRQAI